MYDVVCFYQLVLRVHTTCVVVVVNGHYRLVELGQGPASSLFLCGVAVLAGDQVHFPAVHELGNMGLVTVQACAVSGGHIQLLDTLWHTFFFLTVPQCSIFFFTRYRFRLVLL